MRRRFLRWMLDLDRPLPTLSAAERDAFVERNFRWNATANMVDGLTYWLGLSFISASTIIPLFISKLTSSTLPIGIVAVIAQSGWYLPQLLTANWIERLPWRKPIMVKVGLAAERVPVWGMALAVLISGHSPRIGLPLLLVCYAWRTLGGGAMGPAWQDLIARTIPVDRRGRFWGLTSSLGVGCGVFGSAFGAWLLRTYLFPTSFVIAFVIAASAMTFGWFFLAQTREPPPPPAATPHRSQKEFFAAVPALLGQDRPFRRFLAARVLMAFGAMGSGFVTVSALRRWDVSDGTVGLYTASMLIGQTVGNLLFGMMADRRGHKLSLEWATLAYGAAFALAWLAPRPEWYFAVFALLGFAAGSVVVSGILVLLEFGAPERRPTYIGIANTSVGVASVAGPLLATALASVRVEWVFALSVLFSVAAWAAMRWGVQEPRHRILTNS
jgi:MFS family permease